MTNATAEIMVTKYILIHSQANAQVRIIIRLPNMLYKSHENKDKINEIYDCYVTTIDINI